MKNISIGPQKAYQLSSNVSKQKLKARWV